MIAINKINKSRLIRKLTNVCTKTDHLLVCSHAEEEYDTNNDRLWREWKWLKRK